MLEVENLSIGKGLVNNISFRIGAGERVGLIGESGSGKSLTALAIMGLTDLPRSGSTLLDAEDSWRHRGQRIAMIFQEPMTALNPLMRVGRQIEEMMTLHGHTRARARRRTGEMLADVSLPARTARAYPHELSGGQRQRALITMAMANDPEVLICDEPTTALDVTVQRHIIDLLLRMAEERGTSLLFITHDLGLVAQTCDRLLVMKSGEIVESGATAGVLRSPRHPYTRRLVDASTLSTPPVVEDYGPTVATLDGVRRQFRGTTALDSISLTLRRGERLGVVGGSGSGKTTLLKLLAGLDRPTSGTLRVEGGTQMVFQDPQSSLNPRMRIGEIVAEPLLGWGAREKRERALEVLAQVGLGAEVIDRYPHEFSGGQRQRISIARALSVKPEILLADEPVSALDVSVRKPVLDLLAQLVDEYGLTLVFVSHDLSVVRHICTSVVVMDHGRIVERGRVDEVYDHPRSEFTRALLDAIPVL
ncbi:dipeptide ABC transporter ATP-binding protein [Corynebacterium pacaense]|uniref:dipeptide ABC transporter ATP-binding protein n=1 Tax=Corynebacterium pacaense TaxID=1816684 RepID=UPI0009BB0E71|nr:ABC transporter ATP-binding protein [Corynebacterium pacaense]